jgi:type I restriction enzyme S subunit
MFGSLLRNEKNWPIGRMVDACTYISDGSHYSPPDDMDSEIPMLSVKDMNHNGFDYGDCKHLSRSEYEKLCQNGCKPLLNDVLVAKDGSYFKYIFPLEQEREQAILSSIAILRPDSTKVAPRFLCELLKSKEVLGIVEQNYLTGTAIRRVILKGFRDLKVFFPPLELQNEFERIYNQADKSGYFN